MAKEKILIDTFKNLFDIKVKNKSVEQEITKLVGKFIDSNNTALYANSPLHRLYFSDKREREPFLEIFDLDLQTIKETIKKTPTIKNNWEIVNNPFNIACALAIHSAANNKSEKVLANTLLFLTLSFYSSLHFKYFRFPPNEDVMNYTINNISNKFLFKQYGVVIKALMHTADKTIDTYRELIIRGNDEDIVNFLMYLNTRLNNLMQNFTKEYMKNYNNKNYLNKEKNDSSEDNFNETDSISLRIAQVTAKAVQRFASSTINDKFVNLSSRFCSVSPITLSNALNSIKKNEVGRVSNLIRYTLQVYLNDGKNSYDSITSKKFINYMLTIYSKNNTKNVNINNLKNELDYFLKNHSDKYSNTEREATRVSYRKALFVYFLFFIQNVQMGGS